MKSWQYQLYLYKAYFDEGWNICNYAKYPLFIFGWATKDVKTTIIIGIALALFCFFFGRYLYINGYMDAKNEVMNNYNPFQREVREKLKLAGKNKKFK